MLVNEWVYMSVVCPIDPYFNTISKYDSFTNEFNGMAVAISLNNFNSLRSA